MSGTLRLLNLMLLHAGGELNSVLPLVFWGELVQDAGFNSSLVYSVATASLDADC